MTAVFVVCCGAILVVIENEKKQWRFWLGWFYVVLGSILAVVH